MPECHIAGCKAVAVSGMRLCEKHCARQANRLLSTPGYSFSGVSSHPELGCHVGIRTIENALLLLLWNRNTTGPFDGGDWLEPESGVAYEFLQDHLRKNFAA
jgi:hypothetical protein